MHRKNTFIYFLFCCGLAGCEHSLDPSQHEEVFLEGEQIPGTEIFFPLGQLLPVGDYTPKFSPEGDRIIFSVPPNNEGFAPGLVLINLQTQERRLLVPGGGNFLPDWSSDGEWIAFNHFAQIYKIKANGDSLMQLTSKGRKFSPDWSPDGKYIAYSKSLADDDGPAGAWLLKEDGSESEWFFRATDPDWHPSGQRIIGTIGVSPYSAWVKFIVIDVETKQQESVFSVVKDRNNQYPEYSPDGARIVFWNEEGVWVMNADGSEPKRILPKRTLGVGRQGEGLLVMSPSWHPDGKHIIYEHYRVTRVEQGIDGTIGEGCLSFYVVNVDSALASLNW